MTENLGMRDRVRLEAEPDHIGVWPDLPSALAAPPDGSESESDSQSESESQPQPQSEDGAA
jgi:hypothetical protein